jgi:hypothetical protein
MRKIRVAEHARSPGGRFKSDGPFSGEWFRDEILCPALRQAIEVGEHLSVELGGTSGYGSSFLEEAFGGLIRKRRFSPEQVRQWLSVTAESPVYTPYRNLAERYIYAAKPEPESVAA